MGSLLHFLFPIRYSLHSWIGIAACACFAAQWIIGFIFYLVPKASLYWRELYMPWHRAFGCLIFLAAACAALTGLTEKAFFTL